MAKTTSKTRTVRNVCLTWKYPKSNDRQFYVVQTDNPDAPTFTVPAYAVVEITDELVDDRSFSAEVEMIDGLVPYLKAWDIFDLDITENGFTVSTRLREPQPA